MHVKDPALAAVQTFMSGFKHKKAIRIFKYCRPGATPILPQWQFRSAGVAASNIYKKTISFFSQID